MPEVIQCPTCSKKFKLPDRPPAVFTCTGCGTAMDLSGFQSAAASAPAAPEKGAAAVESKPKREQAGSAARASKSSSRAGGRGAASARSRRGGDDDEGDGEPRGRSAPKKGNPALLWGSLGGIVVLLVVVVLVLNKKGPPQPEQERQQLQKLKASVGVVKREQRRIHMAKTIHFSFALLQKKIRRLR